MHLSKLCALGILPLAHALSSISRHGKYLYNSSDGTRFYVRGVAYQQQGIGFLFFSMTLSYLHDITTGVVANDPNDEFPEPGTFKGKFSSSNNLVQ